MHAGAFRRRLSLALGAVGKWKVLDISGIRTRAVGRGVMDGNSARNELHFFSASLAVQPIVRNVFVHLLAMGLEGCIQVSEA